MTLIIIIIVLLLLFGGGFTGLGGGPGYGYGPVGYGLPGLLLVVLIIWLLLGHRL